MACINNHLLRVNQNYTFTIIYRTTFTREKWIRATQFMNEKSTVFSSIITMFMASKIYMRQAKPWNSPSNYISSFHSQSHGRYFFTALVSGRSRFSYTLNLVMLLQCIAGNYIILHARHLTAGIELWIRLHLAFVLASFCPKSTRNKLNMCRNDISKIYNILTVVNMHSIQTSIVTMH